MIAGAFLESAPLAIFGLVALCVIVHTAEEMGAGLGEPFWRYYGRHFIPRAGDLSGLIGFALLGLSVTAVAYLGLVHEGGSAWWLSALLGLLVADFALSHVGLRIVLPGENPGLLSSFNYAVCVALILIIVRPNISVPGFSAGYWVFGGWWTVSFAFLRRR